MTVDPELLAILVCPKSRGALELVELPAPLRVSPGRALSRTLPRRDAGRRAGAALPRVGARLPDRLRHSGHAGRRGACRRRCSAADAGSPLSRSHARRLPACVVIRRSAAPDRISGDRRASAGASGSTPRHLLTLFGIALSNVALGLAAPRLSLARGEAARELATRRPICCSSRLGLYVLFLARRGGLLAGSTGELSRLRELFTLVAAAAGPPIDRRRAAPALGSSTPLILVASLAALGGLAQFLVGFGSTRPADSRAVLARHDLLRTSCSLVDLLLVARLMFGAAAGESGCGQRGWLGHSGGVARLDGARPHQPGAGRLAHPQRLDRARWSAAAGSSGLAAGAWLLAVLPAAAVLRASLARCRSWRGRSRSPTSRTSRATTGSACSRLARGWWPSIRCSGIGPNMVERLYPIYRHPTRRAPQRAAPAQQLRPARRRARPAGAGELPGAARRSLCARAWTRLPRERAAGRNRCSRRPLAGRDRRRSSPSRSPALFEHNWGDAEVQRVALAAAGGAVLPRDPDRAAPDDPTAAESRPG